MKLSIFTTIGSEGRTFDDIQDPFDEAIDCYEALADEVVLMNGFENQDLKEYSGTKVKVENRIWPNRFNWKFIGEQFQRGYEACSGDWVIHADLDYFFHENNFDDIRRSIDFYPNDVALGFLKMQFSLVDRARIKSRLVIAVNKRKYGNRIKFDSGGDFCQPSLDGKLIDINDIRVLRIPFWNYDFCFKTKECIAKEFHRMAMAQHLDDGKDWGYKSEEEALEFFKNMVVGRFKDGDGWQKVRLEDHPKFIQKKIKNINKDQFGYNMFGWVKDKAYE